MSAPVRVEVLGDPRALVADQPVTLGAKPLAILVSLAVHAPATVSADRLIDHVWGDAPPGGGPRTLRYHVSKLREAIGSSAVVTVPGGYRMGPDVEVDISDAADALVSARAFLGRDDRAALSVLEDVEDWFGISPLGELAELAWARPVVARAEALRRDVVAAMGEALLSTGHPERLAETWHAHLATDPFDERLWAQLATAQVRLGRQADALATLREARGLLAEELGLDPGPMLIALERRVLLRDPSMGSADELPDLAPVGNLDLELRPLFGREVELAEAHLRLEEHRLLTLTGTGGIGKTRVARAVAQSLPPPRHGVWLIEFRGLPPGGDVAAEVAAILGVQVPRDADTAAEISRALRRRELVLLLDNCEHVRDEAATLVERVLSRCPAVRVLATSRAPLGVPGERTLRIGPLPVPGEGSASQDILASPAVELFRATAESVDGPRTPDAEEVGVLAELCRRLDGVPLAIELAAARSRVLTPHELLSRSSGLSQSASGSEADTNREGRGRTVARKHTVAASVDWSADLLDDLARQLWTRLSVFLGPFDLEAAEHLAPDGIGGGAVLAALDGLVAASLVERRPWEGTTLFHMLAPVRERARERLRASPEEEEAAVRGHLSYHKQAVTREELWIGVGATAVRRLTLARHDIAAAVRAAVRLGERHTAVDTCLAAGRLWFTIGFLREPLALAEEVLAAVEDTDDTTRAGIRRHAAMLALELGDHASARARFAEAEALYRAAGDDHAADLQLQNLAVVDLLRGDPMSHRDELRTLASQMEVSAPEAAVYPLMTLASCHLHAGEDAEAVALFEDVIARWEATGDDKGVTWEHARLAMALTRLGRLTEARAALEVTSAGLRAIGADASRGVIEWLVASADLHHAEGEDEVADAEYAEVVERERHVGMREWSVHAAVRRVAIATRRGDPKAIRSAHSTLDTLLADGHTVHPVTREELDVVRADAHGHLTRT